MSKTYYGDGWTDMEGIALVPGQELIVSRPAGKNSSRLARVRLQGFSKLGLRVEIEDKSKLGKWDMPVFNVPYRKDKIYVIDGNALIYKPSAP